MLGGTSVAELKTTFGSSNLALCHVAGYVILLETVSSPNDFC